MIVFRDIPWDKGRERCHIFFKAVVNVIPEVEQQRRGQQKKNRHEILSLCTAQKSLCYTNVISSITFR